MKISHLWLQKYIETELSTEKISEYLTDIGLEVEGVEVYENIKGGLKGIVVGKVTTCIQHPNADKLKKTTVDIGNNQILDIVCGAPNVAEGLLVPIATIGTKIYDQTGGFFEIKEAKIRGEKSQGMICSEKELGIGKNHDGIMVLDPNKFQIGKPLADYFEVIQDFVYEIGLTPNRTDAMSHYGVARDLNAFLVCHNLKSNFKKIEEKKLEITEEKHNFQIEIENETLCPRYIGAVLENVKVADSPSWLQNYLKAIGLSPINNIVDITNYILHSFGQPLHAFDLEKISSKRIKVGNCKKDTKFTTLDGIERTLNGSEIMIKDGENKPLCIAGVFGGLDSGVVNNTQRIFLESAYFNHVAVRKAAKYHGLSTDASFRFERGVDPNITKVAISHAIQLITELAGGKLVGPILENYPKTIENHNITFRFSKLEQILGIKIPREKVKKILNSLEIQINNESEDMLELSIPTYRVDVTREVDVIEEILRIYGYNNVEAPEKMSFTPIKLNLNDQDELENSWAKTLQSNGFHEVMNNSLRLVKEQKNAVKLLNPLSNDLAFMRVSLLEGMLENSTYNANRKSPDIKFFEIGKIYHKNEKYEERKQLALLVSGRELPENWLVPKSVTHFFHLKAYLNLLLYKLNLPLVEQSLFDERFSDGLEIFIKEKSIAKLGKVHPRLLKEFDLEQDAYYAEIELETAQKLRNIENHKIVEVPKFNKVRRDLALLVDKKVQYADLQKIAKKNPSPFLKSIQLFDVYEGKNLPENKKSYALSFELLNESKTLEDKEINAIMESLIKSFEKEIGAELRG